MTTYGAKFLCDPGRTTWSWTVPPNVYWIGIEVERARGRHTTIFNRVDDFVGFKSVPVVPGDVITVLPGAGPGNAKMSASGAGSGNPDLSGGWPDGGTGGYHTVGPGDLDESACGEGGAGSTSLWRNGSLLCVVGGGGGATRLRGRSPYKSFDTVTTFPAGSGVPGAGADPRVPILGPHPGETPTYTVTEHEPGVAGGAMQGANGVFGNEYQPSAGTYSALKSQSGGGGGGWGGGASGAVIERVAGAVTASAYRDSLGDPGRNGGTLAPPKDLGAPSPQGTTSTREAGFVSYTTFGTGRDTAQVVGTPSGDITIGLVNAQVRISWWLENPVAVLSGPTIVSTAGTFAYLNGSYDPDGVIVTSRWKLRLRDSPYTVFEDVTDSGTPGRSFSFPIVAEYQLYLTVTDDNGLQATEVLDITATAAPAPSGGWLVGSIGFAPPLVGC